MGLEPVMHAPPAPSASCELAWDELTAAAEARIVLGTAPAEDCVVEDMNPRRMAGTMRGGVPARLTIDGPAGSGRFYALDLAVGTGDRERHVCITASTVGWRILDRVGERLAPLPWLDDVDRDGYVELVVWQRLPFGQSEVDNALFPVVYVLDGDALVRRDDRARALFARVAAAYRERARIAQAGDPTACMTAVAAFLEAP